MGKYRAIVSTGDWSEETNTVSNPECPGAHFFHTPSPDGYTAKIHWFSVQAKTKRQMRCLCCQRWHWWVDRKPERRPVRNYITPVKPRIRTRVIRTRRKP